MRPNPKLFLPFRLPKWILWRKNTMRKLKLCQEISHFFYSLVLHFSSSLLEAFFAVCLPDPRELVSQLSQDGWTEAVLYFLWESLMGGVLLRREEGNSEAPGPREGWLSTCWLWGSQGGKATECTGYLVYLSDFIYLWMNNDTKLKKHKPVCNEKWVLFFCPSSPFPAWWQALLSISCVSLWKYSFYV